MAARPYRQPQGSARCGRARSGASLDTQQHDHHSPPRPQGGDGRHGAVAQLGERRVRNAKVRGSIPLGSTNKNNVLTVPREIPAQTAVGARPRKASVIALAHDQAALQVEGCTIAADGVPDHFRLFARREAKQLVLPDVDEIPIALRVPERTLGKNKTGGEVLGFRGFKHVRQIVVCGHDALLVSS